jgi:putative ABC transport system permease protein
MLSNYFKTAFRSLQKNKAFTVINIFGLAIGSAATILILHYIQQELDYDSFHENSDNIYRVSVVSKHKDKFERDSHEFVPPLAPAMKKDFPEVEEYVRISIPRTKFIYTDNKPFKVDLIRYADSTLFSVFSFELIAGNKSTALTKPYSLVLSQKTSARIFGNENPVGKIVSSSDGTDYEITGIYEDIPSNSHIQFNAVMSFSTLYKEPNFYMDWNGGNQYTAYLLLNEQASVPHIEKKIPDFMWGYINEGLAAYGVRYEPYLQPLADVHLYHNHYSETLRSKIYIFASVAVFLLLIACVNFINLTISKAPKRAKEVGIRKVLGANRKGLIQQFLIESGFLCVAAFIIALFLVELAFPFYSQLLGGRLESIGIANISQILSVLILLIFVGIIAAVYPAIYITSFQPVKTMKGIFVSGKPKLAFRNVLIVFQFTISVALIISTALINSQMEFIRNKPVGYTRENILVLDLSTKHLKSNAFLLKEEIKKIAGVSEASVCTNVPYNGFTRNGYFPEGFDSPVMIHVVGVDEDYLNTFDIKMADGHNFSKEFGTDHENYLINESLAKQLGWDNPVGKTIARNGEHKVIGVVKDFNFASLYSTVGPLIITNKAWKNIYSFIAVRMNSRIYDVVINSIKNVIDKTVPNAPIEYWFLDDEFNNVYSSDEKFQQLFLSFSTLAIVIALVGLLGLSSYSTQQRIKEIGVRKVLGASVAEILREVSRSYLIIIIAGNILSWLASYYFINLWLEDFAYRISINPVVFIVSSLISIIAAAVTIGSVSLKASMSNPVEALRYE